MNVRIRILNAIAAATIAGAYPAVGFAAEALPPELIACTKERDVIRRLSCFDSVMATLLHETGGEEAAAISAVPDPEPAPAPVPVRPAAAVAPAAPASEAAPASAPVRPAEPESEPHTDGPSEIVTAVAETPVDEAPKAAAVPTQSPPAEPVTVPAAEPPAVASAASVRRETSVYVPDEFTATVTNIRKRPYGELIILLSNGQIWEQKHLDRRFRLEIGDEVTVSKGKVSGYRLRGRGNNSIQVVRLQ